MPKVPRVTETSVGYDVVRGGVTPSPGPSIGGQLAEAGTRVASFVERVQEEENRKVDRTKSIQARVAALQAESDVLNHPEHGALQKKGQDAFGLEGTYLPKLEEAWNVHRQGLTSDAQIQDFDEFTAQRRLAALGQLRSHEATQTDIVHAETAKAADAAHLDFIGRNALDPTQVEFGIGERLKVFDSEAERNGLPEEARQQERERIVATSHAMVVQAYADRKMYVDAEQYAKEHATEIAADAKTEQAVTSFLKVAAAQDKAERRDAQRWARQQQQWSQSDAYEGMSKRLYEGVKPTTTELASLHANYRDAILRQMDGQQPTMDWGLYQQISRMRATDDKAILDVDLQELATRGFDATRIAQVAGWQRDVESGKVAGATEKAVFTDNKAVEMALKPMFVIPSLASVETKARQTQAMNDAMATAARDIEVVRSEKGDAFTLKDRDDIIARHTIEVGRRNDMFGVEAEDAWDDEIPETRMVPVSSIPASFKARVTDLTRRFGIPANNLSPEELSELYTRYISEQDDSKLETFVRAMASSD